MSDRKTILVLLIVAVLLQAMLLQRSGLMEWAAGRPHSAEEVRGLLTDWRVITSVGLVTVILSLAFRWLRLGAGGRDGRTRD